jgi:thioredoxin 2
VTTAHSIEADERGILVHCPKCDKINRMEYARLGQTFRCGNCQTDLQPPNAPVELSSEAAFAALTSQSALPIVVDFWAPWCGPCKMFAPEFARAAQANGGKWIAVKVNTEELPGVAQRFEIRAIPTLALFHRGHEVARKQGALPQTALEKFVAQAIG